MLGPHCVILETTLGPEVTSLSDLGAVAATDMARGPHARLALSQFRRDSKVQELPHQSPSDGTIRFDRHMAEDRCLGKKKEGKGRGRREEKVDRIWG